MKTILITGCAGFIGSHLTDTLLNQGYKIIGIDNFDNFYDRRAKENNINSALKHPNFDFYNLDFTEYASLQILPNFDMVVHLGAKAGVRPSIENPTSYIQTNNVGSQNMLELMKQKKVNKMIFASSSSVYGNNEKIPFSESDNVDNPISPYAFTKKACELMNHTYHHLYQFDIINFRFFTVYGERQRPDLAIYKFVKMALSNKPISIYGDGSTSRDYTYIFDIVNGITAGIEYLFTTSNVYETINLGNSTPIKLIDMVNIIYETLQIKPNLKYLPMQAGDVERTFADISKAQNLLKYLPSTSFTTGIQRFVYWYQVNHKYLT